MARSNFERIMEYVEEAGVSAEELLRALVDWNGTDIIDDSFIENQNDCEGWRIRR